MKILIFASGPLKNGLDSPTPGEGRWAQNLARMLSLNGHTVDVVSGTQWDRPEWGSAKHYPNVTLKTRPGKDEYDLCLYTPWEHQLNDITKWEPCTTLPVRAKWFVHCTFSWGDSIATDHTCWQGNHVLAYPYIQDGIHFPPDIEKRKYRLYPLPLPIYHQYAPIDLANRKDIIWSTKDVFHKDWPEGHHVPRIGLATLNAIKKLRQEFVFNSYFLSTHYFHPQNSWSGRDYKILELVNSIPDSKLFGLLPQDELIGLFQKSKVSTTVSGLLGSFGEAIANSCIPLCYDHLPRQKAIKHGIKLDVFNATEDQIYQVIRKLYTDDEFYLSVIKDYQEEMSYYSYDKSYQYFVDMCKDLGL